MAVVAKIFLLKNHEGHSNCKERTSKLLRFTFFIAMQKKKSPALLFNFLPFFHRFWYYYAYSLGNLLNTEL